MEIEYATIDREATELGELVLRAYRAESGETGHEILLDGSFLMATHGSHSERAMARLAWARLRPPRPGGIRALIGGLGAGHTLRATLDLPGVRQVVVVEIGSKVVEWNRRYFAGANGAAVDDPRVEVRVADVRRVLAGDPGRYHLVLLDVDNGPGWLAAPGNAALYGRSGLETCRAALAPGGVLGIWSPRPNPELERGINEVFGSLAVEDTGAEGRHCREPGSFVYLAHRPAGP